MRNTTVGIFYSTDFFGKLYVHEKGNYFKSTYKTLETKVTLKEQPSIEGKLKNKFELSGNNIETELKATTSANHSFKVNNKHSVGSMDLEFEDELSFNSDERAFKNDFKFAVQPKDLDFRY